MREMSSVVSVIIPTYNRAHLVTQALDSVWAQTHRPLECIVVDDGSTDDTVSVVTDWKRDHYGDSFSMQVLRQENQGAPAARNHGLEAATGEYVLFLDSDDLLTRDALAVLQQTLSESEHEAAYGDILIEREGRQRERRVQRPPSSSDVVTMQRSAPLTSSVMIERAGLNGVRWREELPCAQEFAFFLDLALHEVRFLYESITVLRKRESPSEESISGQEDGNYPLTISHILTDVEPQIRALGPEENQQYDRGLVHLAGILYRKGYKEEGEALFRRADRGWALQSALRRWRTSVFLPALLGPRWNAWMYDFFRRPKLDT